MISKSSKPTKALLALAGLIFVSACASEGPSDNPIVRKFSWLSYLEGGDIRKACRQGAPNSYRLVYNGVYTEQVRMYDIKDDGDLRVQILQPTDLKQIGINKPGDLLSPWRGKTLWKQLSAKSVADVVTALERDGAFATPNVGLELSSKGFFWSVASCHEGQYHFNAWAWPSAEWDALGFDDAVFAVDPSPIPLNPPRKTETRRLGVVGYDDAKENAYWTKVGENGLVGVVDLKR